MNPKTELDHFAALARASRSVARRISEHVPQLTRGQVWCTVCGHTERVNASVCLREGWPRHCGYTMTIDAPDERATR